MTDDTQTLGEIGLMNYGPYLMNRIMGYYNSALRSELAELGLTTPKMRALAVLSVKDGLLIRDLVLHVIVDPSTLSRALDQLEEGALMLRRGDAANSRAIRVFLTEAGRETFARIWPHMAEAYGGMFAGISPEERHAFVATLHKVLSNIRNRES